MAPTKAQLKRKHISDSPQKVSKKGKARQVESSSEDEWKSADESSDDDETPDTSLEHIEPPRTRSKGTGGAPVADSEEPVASEPCTPKAGKSKATKSKATKSKAAEPDATEPKATKTKAIKPRGKSGRAYGLMTTEVLVHFGRTGIQAQAEIERLRAIRSKERRAELRSKRKVALVQLEKLRERQAIARISYDTQQLQAEMLANTSEAERVRQHDETMARLQRECEAFKRANSKLVLEAEKSRQEHQLALKEKDESIAQVNLQLNKQAIDLKALEVKMKEMDLSAKMASMGN